MKALFYIQGKNIQHIDCRVTVTNALIRMGFKKGGAFNLPDGRIEVVLEGSNEDINRAYKEITENLADWLKEDCTIEKS